MPLRLKLLIAIVVLVVAGLAVADVATYTSLRSFLLERFDQQLGSSVPVVEHALTDPNDPFVSLLPTGTVGILKDSTGATLVRRTFSYDSSAAAVPQPDLPADLNPGTGPNADVHTTCGATTGSTRFRVLAQQVTYHQGFQGPDQQGTLIVAAPLTDLEQTLGRLRTIEVLVSLGVLLVLGAVSWWLVRREMRPLERIETTAGAIAAGDLTQRVPEDARTEVGRLGIALNVMLAQIERAFAERRASEDRLRRFLADASHELRTPLTSIRGYAELFRRGASENEADLAKSMTRIESESRRMGTMVEDLLLLARLDQDRPLELRPVDLGALATDAVHDARAAFPSRAIAVRAEDGVWVQGDDARLRQVAANLLSNALVHTDADVEVGVARDDGHAVLEIADHGPGLPVDGGDRIFEPFYRSDPSRDRATGGVGLGLAIVAAIAKAHGGEVTANETSGGGATFRVAIPTIQPQRPDEADQN